MRTNQSRARGVRGVVSISPTDSGRLRRPQQIDKWTGSSRRAAVGQPQTQPKQHRGAAHAWQDDARSHRIG